MKSFIGLALIAVLCAVEVSAIIKDPVFTIVDKNHEKQEDREIEFSCTFTKEAGDTNIVATIIKNDDAANPINLFIVNTQTTVPTINYIPDKITHADFVADLKDPQQTKLTLKKAGAPNPVGSYICTVVSGITTITSKVQKIYAESETIAFDVAVKDAGDKKDEFKNEGQLDASCSYTVPTGKTLKTLEVSAVDKPIATGTFADNKFTFAYPKPEGFSDVVAKEDGKKVVVTVTKLTDKSGGAFKCKYEVEDDTAEKNKLPITSKPVELKHVNGAAANVASLTLLVLAVTSYFKLSL